MKQNQLKPKFLAVDFFCGAGGTTRGILDSGGYVIAGIDKDASCRTTYTKNNANTTLDRLGPLYIESDMIPETRHYPTGKRDCIRDQLDKIITKYRLLTNNIPLLFTICPPCQSFTKYVQRSLTYVQAVKRIHEQFLLTHTIDLIAQFRPEIILVENVPGVRKGKFGEAWSDFQLILRFFGYCVGESVVCTSRFGIPQNRRRSLILALKQKDPHKSSTEIEIPSRNPNASMVSTKEAIAHLPKLAAGETNPNVPNHVCRNLTKVNQMRLKSLRPGEPNTGLHETTYGDLALPCHKRLGYKGYNGFRDVYTRMHGDKPAPTITTRFHSISNGRFGHFDMQQIRGLSLREGAILQSFDQNYVFDSNGMDNIARMIGNAAPPKLVSFMVHWLHRLWINQTY